MRMTKRSQKGAVAGGNKAPESIQSGMRKRFMTA